MSDELRLMKFKVELQLNDRVFSQRYTCYGLAELHDMLHKEFPKAKILSIFGGPA